MNPVTGNRCTARFDGVEISSEFPGGAGADIVEVAPKNYRLTIPSDPDCRGIPGYDYYFCVRISGRDPRPPSIRLETIRPNRPCPGQWRLSRVPLFASEDFTNWFVVDGVEASSGHEEFRATLDLPGQSTLYVTNSLPCPSARVRDWLARTAERRPLESTLKTIGESVLGRPLQVLTVTAPGERSSRDRVLVTSGFHPAEPDWLATTTIAERLLADDDPARAMRERLVVDLVVHVNPDGFDLGTNATNARGINLYWDFRHEDVESSPEAVALWKWAVSHPPSYYLDFHAYVYQMHKNFRPYLRPTSEYHPSARRVVRAIDRALLSLCKGRAVKGDGVRDGRTLAPQITAALGTITYPKFHLHLNHGVPACRELGWLVFEAVVGSASRFPPLPEMTGGGGWIPGRGDRFLAWLQQGHQPLRVRRNLNRLLAAFGMKERVVEHVVQEGEGLAAHWRAHLWSDRRRVVPAFSASELAPPSPAQELRHLG